MFLKKLGGLGAHGVLAVQEGIASHDRSFRNDGPSYRRDVPPVRRAQLRPVPRVARTRRGVAGLGRPGAGRYLDLFPGWGCNLLGHCPPEVVAAVQEQVATLIHVPNSWYTEAQGEWARLLSERSFGGQAFFCNSGAEANEAAIKLVRLHTPEKRYKIITFTGGFHGRTLGATTATAQPKYHEGLGPLVAGFQYAPFGDLDAVRELVDDETAGILVEPIQGEGGIRLPPRRLPARPPRDRRRERAGPRLRRSPSRHGADGRVVRLPELWTGASRPDVMTLAKSLCGGVAGGAMLCTPEIAPSLRPGMHAATFGGNPLSRRAGGIATIEAIEKHGLLDRAKQLGEKFKAELSPLVDELPIVTDLRVCGLMIGLELATEGAPIVQKLHGARPADQLHPGHGPPAAARDDAHRRRARRGVCPLGGRAPEPR